MDEWTQARRLVASQGLTLHARHTSAEAAGLAGPCPANRFYTDGVLEPDAPVHVQASARVAALPDADFVPFEVRIPPSWLSAVEAGYGVAPQDAYTRQDARSRVERDWYGTAGGLEPRDPLRAGYARASRRARHEGHSDGVVEALLLLLEAPGIWEDRALALRATRALCVGAGRRREPRLAERGLSASERFKRMWLDAGEGAELELSLLLRAEAFASMLVTSSEEALQSVRAATGLMLACQEASPARESFVAYEALFPTLETGALCEAMWGDVEASVRLASSLTEAFPFDGRAWIRLGRSLLAHGSHDAAVSAFLRAASAELPGWLPCLVAARLATRSEESSFAIDQWLTNHNIDRSSLCPTQLPQEAAATKPSS